MLTWVHGIPSVTLAVSPLMLAQSALAAAVATLGLVILLELRSIARLRRSVDGHLERVFEQLDLLRFESQQLLESQSSAPEYRPSGSAESPAAVPASMPAGTLPAGEARLLASLAAARARRAATQPA